MRSELDLNLTDAVRTHQPVITVNGKNIRTTIPAGIEEGQVNRLRSLGSAGVNGDPNGDLYTTFMIKNNPHYKRMGNDLHITIPVDLYVAVQGGGIIVDAKGGPKNDDVMLMLFWDNAWRAPALQ